MTSGKLGALVLVYLVVAVGWIALGGEVTFRTQTSEHDQQPLVESLWGKRITQFAPVMAVEAKPENDKDAQPAVHAVEPDSSEIKVNLHLDFRRKGLLWYRTYVVDFDATYTVKHEFDGRADLVVKVGLPSARGTYDNFLFSVNDEAQLPAGDAGDGTLTHRISLPKGDTATVRLRYTTRGLDQWAYKFAQEVAAVKDFRLAVTTDFSGLDFPTLSPTSKEYTGGGWRLDWDFASHISGLEVAIDMPERLNPGPLAARISLFAPVGLLFFLSVMAIVGMVKDRNMHPMHYLFVCAAFFAFHLLFSYLVDLIEINVAFAISAVVSVLMVASYVVRFMGPRYTFLIVAPAQLVFLILFSYAFFFQGYTGLTITIASIITLAAMMHITAKVDWDERLGTKRAAQ